VLKLGIREKHLKHDNPQPPLIKGLPDLLLLAAIRGGFNRLVGAKVIVKVKTK
jgi:hypothetical protein